ncbi:MAG: cytochrome c oxidase subunit I [Deinococcota bacterium]
MSSITARPEARTAGTPAWWLDLLVTVDHKKIGLMYLVTSFIFFALGGVAALLIRIQLSRPDMEFLVGQFYNQILTMHGSTMQFLFIIPVAAAFGNYFVPLMIGARDMALPRMNAFAYWLYLFGGLLIYAAPLFGGMAEGGWVAYFPFSSSEYQPSAGLDTWILGLQLVGFASIFGGMNLIATVVNLRAPGMGWRQIPMFVWAMIATSFLQVLATPGITAATMLTYLDRTIDISLFNPAIGGDPILYQHLFWFYSHPAVYIMVLPWFGIVSEMLPVFSRKPIFGYTALAGATMGIALVSFLVWAHHIFTSMGSPLLNSVFAFTTMLVAVPTGVKIFNWIATVWRGKLVFNTAMLMSLCFIFLFTISGITGVALAVVPFTWQMHDSYWVVAHFHNVLIGGSVFIIFAGVFYWFPKMTGRMLDETLGKWLTGLWFVGFMVTYFPHYILGLLGMPRRIYTYQDGLGWGIWNAISSLGSFMLAAGFLLFIYNVVISLRKPKDAGDNPWDAYSLEWATSSPPPAYNFAFNFPTTYKSERPLYDWKKMGVWPPVESERLGLEEIHLPNASYWPILTTVGLTVMLIGMVLQGGLTWLGLAITLVSAIAWSFEPAFESEEVELEVQHHNRTSMNNGILSTYWFLGSEIALFLMMFSAYFYLLFTGRMADMPAEMPNVGLAVINTTFLLGSSVTVHFAHHDLLHGKRKTFIGLLAGTILLGLCFLGFTWLEWQELLATGDPTENLYLAAFFSITGLHGLHVILGLTMLTVALVRGMLGQFTPKLNNGMEVPTAYWHLVDGVWIFVLLFIYIIPTFYQGPEQVFEAVDPFSVYEREAPTEADDAMPVPMTMPAETAPEAIPEAVPETTTMPEAEGPTFDNLEDRMRDLNERLQQTQ